MEAGRLEEVLQALRQRIGQPEAWTKGCDARAGGAGVECEPEEGAARAWCLVGALAAVACGKARTAAYRLLAHLAERSAGPGTLTGWNDAPGRTHDEVLQLVDGAIGQAQMERRRSARMRGVEAE